MKKIFLVIFAIFVFVLFNTNAHALEAILCKYHRPQNNSTAFISINNNQYNFFYEVNSDMMVDESQRSNVQNIYLNLIPIYGPFKQMINTIANLKNTLNMVANVNDYYRFTLTGPGLKAAYPIDMHDTESQWKSGFIDVDDNRSAMVRDSLLNYGYCPKHVYVNFSSKEITMFNSDSVLNSINSQEWLYTLQDNGSLLTSDVYADVNIGASNNTCVSDVNKLKNANNAMKYLLVNTTYLDGKSKFVVYLNNSGVTSYATYITRNYDSGQKCYKSISDKNLAHELVNNAKSILDLVESGGNIGNSVQTCSDIIGDPNEEGDFAYYLNSAFNFIQYLGPVILIIISIIDYARAISSGDKDIISKLNKKSVTRIIFVFLLFFIPLLIKIILTMFGMYSNCGI